MSSTDPEPDSQPPDPIELDIQNPARLRRDTVHALEPWIRELVADLAPGVRSLGVRLTGEREMRDLNRRFRRKDEPTDVLSFPGEESPEGRHLGDIAISVPTARRQANAQGHELSRELQVLLLHGVLHCLGYDHETDDETMDRLEAKLRPRWIGK